MLTDYLFPRGFVCYRDADEPQGDNVWKQIRATWSTLTIGAYRIRYCPEGSATVLPMSNAFVVLIGEAFSTDESSVEGHLGDIGIVDGRLTGAHALAHLSGRFAVILIASDACVVLNDAFGARSIFFTSSGCPALGSHAALLAHAFVVRRRRDVADLLKSAEYEARKVKYLPGNATVYEGIHALIPNTYFDFDSGRLVRYWPTVARTQQLIDDFLVATDVYLSSLVRFFSDSRREPLFGITGGIDSRTVFAAFVAQGVPFRGVTWQGGYIRHEEKAIVADLAARLRIDHAYLDPVRFTPTEVAMASERNAGRMRKPSKLTQGMHALFGDNRRLIFVRGYGGEIIRGFYNLRRGRMRSYNPAEMASMYADGRIPANVSGDFWRSVNECFEDFYEAGGYEQLAQLGFDPSDIFYWEHRMGMWGSTMLNEMDAAVHSMVGLNSRRLYELAFGLPDEVRLTKELLRKVVARQNSWLADLPFA